MRSLILLAALTLAALPARAHEFWISPVFYSIAPEDQLLADLRVGETFKGNASSFVPQRFARFDLVVGDSVTPVEGRLGDRPALAMAPPQEGLVVVVHQTADLALNYAEWQKFVNFVEHKDFKGTLDAHAARGLPQTGFKELYSRYAKSLIAVGDGAGADREVGLLTEIVALANPYTDDLSSGLPVRVLYQGAPRPDAQVEVFDKAPDGTTTVALYRTNADGEAQITVTPGHEYLIDAVVLRAADPETQRGAVWESLWASLTLMVPTK